MTRKTGGTNITIKGDVRAKHDVVMGDQYNTVQIASIQSPNEFTQALAQLREQISALRQSGELSKPVQTNLEAAEAKVIAAEEETRQSKPAGERIGNALSEAKEYMDLITGSLQSAVGLGTTLGGLAMLALKVFGG